MALRPRLDERGRGIRFYKGVGCVRLTTDSLTVAVRLRYCCCCCSAAWRSDSGASWRTEDQSSDSISVSGGGGLSEGATRTATVNSLAALPLKTPRVGGTSA